MDEEVKAFRGCARNMIFKASLEKMGITEGEHAATDESRIFVVENPKAVEVADP